MQLFKKRSPGFSIRSVYKVKKPSLVKLLKKKLSFLIASLSLFSFVIGNMVGQHGWYAFWKTVMGKADDALVVFVGTVPPVSRVPDYRKWAKYGGNAEDHTFRQVPRDALIPLPAYDPVKRNSGDEVLTMVYPVGFLGSYKTGKDHGGSHNGIDIDVPLGTPVVSIGNGIVEKTSMQEHGFGHFVVIRHPNVPDPENPGKTRVFYSTYAHLDAVLVAEGQVVHKGEQIGTSGKSGDTSGPHLHFQVDKGGTVEDGGAPYHPYWVFTGSEAREAGMSFSQAINSGLNQSRGDLYSVSPMLFVQAYQSFVPPPTTVVQAEAKPRVLTAAERRAQRTQARRAKAPARVAALPKAPSEAEGSSSSSSSQAPAEGPERSRGVVSIQTVAQADSIPPVLAGNVAGTVDRLSIEHSGKMQRAWQKVTITALDRDGKTVPSPVFSGRLYLVSEFGEAEIRPKELTSLDFSNGIATVSVLTRGTKTVFIATRGAFTATSGPMVNAR